jgi:hypothetical protein
MVSYSSSSVICQTTGPQPLPKRFLHLMRSRASSFNWEYPLLPPRSFSNFLRLIPRLLVSSICPFILPSITCFRRQFLRKIWPIQLAFRFLISCRIFLCSLTLSNSSSFLSWSLQYKPQNRSTSCTSFTCVHFQVSPRAVVYEVLHKLDDYCFGMLILAQRVS